MRESAYLETQIGRIRMGPTKRGAGEQGMRVRLPAIRLQIHLHTCQPNEEVKMKSIVRAAIVATLLSTAASVVAPAYAADAPKLTKEVNKDLAAAQAALKTNDYATALTSVQAAQAVADRTPYD